MILKENDMLVKAWKPPFLRGNYGKIFVEFKHLEKYFKQRSTSNFGHGFNIKSLPYFLL